MAESRTFLLDANVFIDAHRRYYGFDLCPGFWTALVRQHQEHRVFSVDRVRQEISKGTDKLKKWARQKDLDAFFRNTNDQATLSYFGDMSDWVQGESQYTSEAKSEFATVADGWLVACAKACEFVVVTHEVYSPEAKRKVPIPNVCRHFAVECVDTFQMLRELKVRFALRKRKGLK